MVEANLVEINLQMVSLFINFFADFIVCIFLSIFYMNKLLLYVFSHEIYSNFFYLYKCFSQFGIFSKQLYVILNTDKSII